MVDYLDMLAEHLGHGDAAPRTRGRVVHDAMRAREVALLEPLMEYLRSLNHVRLLGPVDAGSRAPTVAIHGDRPGGEIAEALAALGLNACGGDFYAVRPLEAMGIDPAHGVLRVSFTHYTSEDEVTRLIEALDQVL